MSGVLGHRPGRPRGWEWTTVSYRVSGTSEHALDRMAPMVDQVLTSSSAVSPTTLTAWCPRSCTRGSAGRTPRPAEPASSAQCRGRCCCAARAASMASSSSRSSSSRGLRCRARAPGQIVVGVAQPVHPRSRRWFSVRMVLPSGWRKASAPGTRLAFRERQATPLRAGVLFCARQALRDVVGVPQGARREGGVQARCATASARSSVLPPPGRPSCARAASAEAAPPWRRSDGWGRCARRTGRPGPVGRRHSGTEGVAGRGRRGIQRAVASPARLGTSDASSRRSMWAKTRRARRVSS